jgi:hypothetical protein
MAAAAVGFLPGTANAVSCLPDVEGTTVDDKYVTRTCWDCGWIMINDQPHTLFYCD